MDTSLNLPAPALQAASPAPVTNTAITRKVTPVDVSHQSATRPTEKPFVAQVVSARLSGTEFPEKNGEIVPPDRTLRPYDVPMLPYDGTKEMSSDAADSGNPTGTPAREEP